MDVARLEEELELKMNRFIVDTVKAVTMDLMVPVVE